MVWACPSGRAGIVREVEALHEGFSFGPDASAHFENPYGNELSCKPSPFETAMPASWTVPDRHSLPARRPERCHRGVHAAGLTPGELDWPTTPTRYVGAYQPAGRHPHQATALQDR
jgi:hypothetical protein